MLAKYMTIKGHDCSVSNDGRAGLDVIMSNHYDVILLDLAMPEFSGFDIVDALTRAGMIRKINVVALTASSVSSEKDNDLREKGVRAVLRKPIDPDDLLKYLSRFEGKTQNG